MHTRATETTDKSYYEENVNIFQVFFLVTFYILRCCKYCVSLKPKYWIMYDNNTISPYTNDVKRNRNTTMVLLLNICPEAPCPPWNMRRGMARSPRRNHSLQVIIHVMGNLKKISVFKLLKKFVNLMIIFFNLSVDRGRRPDPYKNFLFWSNVPTGIEWRARFLGQKKNFSTNRNRT